MDNSNEIISARQSAELCQACGICCTGAFFSHVNLTPEEATALDGTQIKTYIGKKGKPVFDQPCVALSGTSCSIYEKRPGACRAFLCGLTRGVLNGTTDLETALDTVSRMKALIAWLLDNVPDDFKGREPVGQTPLVAAKEQYSAENVFAAWRGGDNKAEAVEAVRAKTLWQLLNDLHRHFSKKQESSALTPADSQYITNAFAFAKLRDRQFAETKLLRKYSQLVQQFSA